MRSPVKRVGRNLRKNLKTSRACPHQSLGGWLQKGICDCLYLDPDLVENARVIARPHAFLSALSSLPHHPYSPSPPQAQRPIPALATPLLLHNPSRQSQHSSQAPPEGADAKFKVPDVGGRRLHFRPQG